jgi:hypothetical protein
LSSPSGTLRIITFFDVLDDHHVEVRELELVEALRHHRGVEVTEAARVDLNRADSFGGHRFGIHLRIDVRLDHPESEARLELRDGPEDGPRLSRARRGHQVHQEDLLVVEPASQRSRGEIVVGVNVLRDLDQPHLVHQSTSMFATTYSLPEINRQRDPPQPGQAAVSSARFSTSKEREQSVQRTTMGIRSMASRALSAKVPRLR